MNSLSGPASRRVHGIEQYAGIAAPDLVLVDAGGKVLSDSFRHGIFAGIGEVIDDIERLVPP